MSSNDLFFMVEGNVMVEGSVGERVVSGMGLCPSSGFFSMDGSGLEGAGKAGNGVVVLIEGNTSEVDGMLGVGAVLVVVDSCGTFNVNAGAVVVVEGADGGAVAAGKEKTGGAVVVVLGTDGCATCPKMPLVVVGEVGRVVAGCVCG
jgi:hypothetical protein